MGFPCSYYIERRRFTPGREYDFHDHSLSPLLLEAIREEPLSSAAVLAATDELREFMFERVYLHEATLRQAQAGQALVRALYRYYEAQPDEIAGWSVASDPAWRRAADYVSGMTDRFATKAARDLGLP